MKSLFARLSTLGIIAGAVILGSSAPAVAHVTVKPAEVVTAGFQTFTIGVPNEKEIPTTSIKLLIPKGLNHVSPTQKSGWQIDIEKTGEGENEVATSITWSEGTISDGFRDEFTFSAQVPKAATELQWKAYQTYSDGTVVTWDKAEEGGHGAQDNSGPFSVTNVVAETAQQSAIKNTEDAAKKAKTTADRALYTAIAATVIGLIGIFIATRKQP